MGVGEEPVSYLASEQLIDRLVERLAFDVPQGEVHRADGSHRDRPPAPVDATVEVLPGVLDPVRVQADQQRRDVISQIRRHRQFASVDRSIAPPDDPIIGGDLEGHVVAARAGKQNLGASDCPH